MGSRFVAMRHPWRKMRTLSPASSTVAPQLGDVVGVCGAGHGSHCRSSAVPLATHETTTKWTQQEHKRLGRHLTKIRGGCAGRAVADAWRSRLGGTTFPEGGARQESDGRLRHTHAEARVVLATARCAVGPKEKWSGKALCAVDDRRSDGPHP